MNFEACNGIGAENYRENSACFKTNMLNLNPSIDNENEYMIIFFYTYNIFTITYNNVKKRE